VEGVTHPKSISSHDQAVEPFEKIEVEGLPVQIIPVIHGGDYVCSGFVFGNGCVARFVLAR